MAIKDPWNGGGAGPTTGPVDTSPARPSFGGGGGGGNGPGRGPGNGKWVWYKDRGFVITTGLVGTGLLGALVWAVFFFNPNSQVPNFHLQTAPATGGAVTLTPRQHAAQMLGLPANKVVLRHGQIGNNPNAPYWTNQANTEAAWQVNGKWVAMQKGGPQPAKITVPATWGSGGSGGSGNGGSGGGSAAAGGTGSTGSGGAGAGTTGNGSTTVQNPIVSRTVVKTQDGQQVTGQMSNSFASQLAAAQAACHQEMQANPNTPLNVAEATFPGCVQGNKLGAELTTAASGG